MTDVFKESTSISSINMNCKIVLSAVISCCRKDNYMTDAFVKTQLQKQEVTVETQMCVQRISSPIRFSLLLNLCHCLQMAAKMGGDQMPNMNSSSPVIDPSFYSFGGQKRSLDNGGESSVHAYMAHHYVCRMFLFSSLSDTSAFILHNMYVGAFLKTSKTR